MTDAADEWYLLTCSSTDEVGNFVAALRTAVRDPRCHARRLLKTFSNEIYRWRVDIQFNGYTKSADRECDFLRSILMEETRAVDMQTGRIEREAVIVVDKMMKLNHPTMKISSPPIYVS